MTSVQKKEWIVFLGKLPSLFFGFMLYSLAVLLMRDGGLGMNPWGVFHMGLSHHTPFTLGQVTQLMGLVILISSLALKVTPGFGSIGNMVFIGFFVDQFDRLEIISTPDSLLGQILMLTMGIIITGWATFFYLRVKLGAGPRDGLMEGLVKKTGKPVWLIRGAIEITVLIIGYLLGGPVGLGTLFAATAIGPSVQFAFKIGGYDSKSVKHMNCVDLCRSLRGEALKEGASLNK